MFFRPPYPQTRMRRLRRHPYLRTLVQETHLTPQQLIQPLFVAANDELAQNSDPALPALRRLTLTQLATTVKDLSALGITAVAIFPVIEHSHKSDDGREAYNAKGLVPQAIATIKNSTPDLQIITDVALDPFTSHGQDGITDKKNNILNEDTIAALTRQAVCYADAGADIVAPSDMMDGRIGAIRNALDDHHHFHTVILTYAAKYASDYYYPFRQALGSAERLGSADKKTYQMNIRNSDEALHECALDLQEGADILMVKPAMPCLDIIHRVKKTFQVPVFAYQVSGEYAMHSAAFHRQWLNKETIILESLISIKRAGSDAILSYFAREAAELLQ